MDILQDQWKRALTEILLAGLSHRAGGRVRPERFVIRSAVVVARHTESARSPKDEHRRRDPRGHPVRLCPEPGVQGIANQLRRVKWRKVRTEPVMLALQRRPGGVDDERGESEKNSDR